MENKIVVAAIVSQEQPPRVVTTREGRLPEMQFSPEHGTTEGTLYALGREVLKNTTYVSVDRARPLGDKRLYQTKPISPEALPEGEYQWAACPPIIELADL